MFKSFKNKLFNLFFMPEIVVRQKTRIFRPSEIVGYDGDTGDPIIRDEISKLIGVTQYTGKWIFRSRLLRWLFNLKLTSKS